MNKLLKPLQQLTLPNSSLQRTLSPVSLFFLFPRMRGRDRESGVEDWGGGLEEERPWELGCLAWSLIKISATLQDSPFADRYSAFIFL